MKSGIHVKTFQHSSGKKAGFTLLQMAMVIIIMGSLASVTMSFFTAMTKRVSYKVTQDRQETIKKALISYLRKNYHLPCPDIITIGTIPDGNEKVTGTTCDSSFGTVPYKDLGLPRTDVIDGWNNFFLYHVSRSSVIPAIGDDWTVANGSLNDSSTGEIYVLSRDTNGILTTPTSANAVVVILSHGPNGDRAYTAKGFQNGAAVGTDEIDNSNGNSDGITTEVDTQITYTTRSFDDNTASTGGAFDDIILSLNTADLTGQLITEGTVVSASNSSREHLAEINYKLTSYLLDSFSGNSCTPPVATSVDTTLTNAGAWGTVTYTPNAANITSSSSNATIIYTVSIVNNSQTYTSTLTKLDASMLFADAGAKAPSCLSNSSGYGELATQFATIRNTYVGYMFTNFQGTSCDFPDLATMGLATTDIWGGTITQSTPAFDLTADYTTTIYSFTSNGPDGTAGNSDDRTITLTKQQAIDLYTKAGTSYKTQKEASPTTAFTEKHGVAMPPCIILPLAATDSGNQRDTSPNNYDDVYVADNSGPKLEGKGGNDTLMGGTGTDDLRGGIGNDSLYGGDGNDTLKGEKGYDILFGGDGDDLFEYKAELDVDNDNGDTVDGGNGTDRIILGKVNVPAVSLAALGTDKKDWFLDTTFTYTSAVNGTTTIYTFDSPPASGTITFGNGDKVVFSNIEEIEWKI
ncbi:MAG: hypothetical protein HQL69_05825 [Magnetococcales bacterium]|nr:hypothetical protein [Magnetococcales bacterium]